MVLEWWVVLLAFGVVARVTRFLNSDTLAGPIRAWVQRRFGEDSLTADFVECPWCVSIWVSAAVVPIAWLWGETPGFVIPALVLSLSYACALVATNLDS